MAKGYFWTATRASSSTSRCAGWTPWARRARSIRACATCRAGCSPARAGEIGGTRLLSEEMHAETWKHHMDLALGRSRAATAWAGSSASGGRRMVEHAGGIDGFTAEVAMLPDENVGMVMLTNQLAARSRSSPGRSSSGAAGGYLGGGARVAPRTSSPTRELHRELRPVQERRDEGAREERASRRGRAARWSSSSSRRTRGQAPVAITDSIAVRFNKTSATRSTPDVLPERHDVRGDPRGARSPSRSTWTRCRTASGVPPRSAGPRPQRDHPEQPPCHRPPGQMIYELRPPTTRAGAHCG